jgi:hypothetical protein
MFIRGLGMATAEFRRKMEQDNGSAQLRIFISSTGPNKKNNSTIFHHADVYMHLDPMHIPEAQSFPKAHGL